MIRRLKRRAYGLVGIFALLLGGLVALGAAPAVAAPPTWSLVPVNNTATVPAAGLGEVSCWSSTGCLATNRLGTVLRRNGATWTDVSPGNLPAGTGITDVACATAMFCVLGGETSSAVVLRSWDGSGWHTMPAPTGVQPAYIFGLSCPTASFCAAVGETSRATAQQAVVVIWNGSTWTGRYLPVAGGLDPNKTMRMGDISCKSAKACVVIGNTEHTVGLKFGVDTVQPFASSFDGTSWTVHPVPNALSPAIPSSYPGIYEHHAQLYKVSCWAGHSCAAAGFGFNGSSLLKYVNGTWTLTTRSSASTSSENGISCSDATHCVAAHGTDTGGNIDIWNGKAWHSVYVGPLGWADVSCVSKTSCVAVGGNNVAVGPNTWHQKQVSLPQTPLVSGLNEISCSSDSHCVAIGSNVLFSDAVSPTLTATWNGSSWATSGQLMGLTSITCPDDNTCFAVGTGGIIMRQSSGNWQIATTAVHAALLSCSSATSCLALGPPIFNALNHGTHENAWRWNGQTWSTAATLGDGSPARFDAAQLSCPTASFCLAVGQGFDGTNYAPAAYSWNGATWTKHLITGFAANSNVQLVSVSCTTATDCMAVGGSGTALIAQWDGSALTQMTAPADTSGLESVSCSAASSCVAIGREPYSPANPTNNSASLIWNGVSWTSSSIDLLPSGKNTVLHAVACTAHQCSAVGADEQTNPAAPIAEQLR